MTQKPKNKQPTAVASANNRQLEIGDTFLWRGKDAKIMAIADGYAMARLKGCVPFIVRLKELKNDVKP